jgi:hypothetical protein
MCIHTIRLSSNTGRYKCQKRGSLVASVFGASTACGKFTSVLFFGS